MSDTTVIVLAGGIGKRFWPIATSKTFFQFFGKPFLSYILEQLKKIGLTKIVLVTSPNDIQHVKSFDTTGIELQIVTQDQPLGMGDAVLLVQSKVPQGPVLIINGDDLVDESLFLKISEKINQKNPFTVGKHVSSYVDAGYLNVKNNRVIAIVEKPGSNNTPSDYINLVFDYFPDITDFYTFLRSAKNDNDDKFEVAYDQYIKKNDVSFLEYDGVYAPLKYPWHVLTVLDNLLRVLPSHQGNNVYKAQNVVIVGNVWIGDNVKLMENTKIVGPCYIGNNTVVGNNNMIRNSYIGDNCVTGFSTDITRSYIANNCWFHSNYIGDSVVMDNVSMGAGSVLANLRLDDGEINSTIKETRHNTKRIKLGAVIGENSRIGVNASIMPGVKIGRHTYICAGAVVSHDVPDESFLIIKNTMEIVKNNKANVTRSRDSFKKNL